MRRMRLMGLISAIENIDPICPISRIGPILFGETLVSRAKSPNTGIVAQHSDPMTV